MIAVCCLVACACKACECCLGLVFGVRLGIVGMACVNSVVCVILTCLHLVGFLECLV